MDELSAPDRDRLRARVSLIAELGPGLSTIRKYVEALGGRLEIVADFGDERLVLG